MDSYAWIAFIVSYGLTFLSGEDSPAVGLIVSDTEFLK